MFLCESDPVIQRTGTADWPDAYRAANRTRHFTARKRPISADGQFWDEISPARSGNRSYSRLTTVADASQVRTPRM
jgi:hypothetical protein